MIIDTEILSKISVNITQVTLYNSIRIKIK